MEGKLALPRLPRGSSYLFDIYWRIRRRKGGGMGPSPIEWPDIDAFVRNSHFDLKPWEIEIIEALDNVYMAEQAKQARAR